MADPTTVAAVDFDRSGARSRSRDRFYVGMSGLLLFLVVGGFAPTFTLKTVFDGPELPLYLHMHGAILTAWYVIAFVQPLLVAAGRTELHKRLGIAALFVAASVVAVGAVVLVNFVPHRFAQSPITAISTIFYGDVALLLLFVCFVVAAVLARRRPDTHKRLMLLASFSIVGPALGRWARFGDIAAFNEITVVLVAYGLLTAIFVLHDLFTLRTVHRATLVALLAFWALVFAVVPLSGTQAALALISRLT